MPKNLDLHLPGKPKPYIMAHRGSRALLPENTQIAFQRAITDGADIIETDLHLTADGVIVCIHDSTVDRTTDGHGAVAEMNLASLKMLNAAASRPDLPPQRILTLMEMAALLPPDVALALELKTDRFLETAVCQQLAAELSRTNIRARTIVISFSMERIQAVRQAAPDIPIGLITMSKIIPPKNVDLVGPFWPLALLNPFYVRMGHAQGQYVCPLDPTPDRRARLYAWLGSDAILTDDPAATRRALNRTPPTGAAP